MLKSHLCRRPLKVWIFLPDLSIYPQKIAILSLLLSSNIPIFTLPLKMLIPTWAWQRLGPDRGDVNSPKQQWINLFTWGLLAMDSSTNFQAPPQAAYFLWSCDKVYHKQEVCFLLYFLGQIVSWQYYPNLLD